MLVPVLLTYVAATLNWESIFHVPIKPKLGIKPYLNSFYKNEGMKLNVDDIHNRFTNNISVLQNKFLTKLNKEEKKPLMPTVIKIDTTITTTTVSPTFSSEKDEIIPDPRLVPYSIFSLKCRPGIHFHHCVNLCIDSKAKDIKKDNYKKERINETIFHSCIDDCRIVYLNTTINGCMKDDGTYYAYDKSVKYDDIHEGQSNINIVKAKSAYYKTVSSFGHIYDTFISNFIAILIVTIGMFLYHWFKVPLYLFIIIYGQDHDDIESNQQKKLLEFRETILNSFFYFI